MRKWMVVWFLALIAGCGSGGKSDEPHDHSAAATDGSGPASGVIVIEERGGKRVLDGWFSAVSATEQVAVQLWQDGFQHCETATWPVTAPDSTDGAAWRQSLFAGDTIDIRSRTGNVVSLRAQRYGSTVLYASEERWLSQPLPDDARLQVPGSDDFPAFESIALKPLAPLIRTAPVNGISDDLAMPITWEGSAEVDDEIELLVSQHVSGAAMSATAMSVTAQPVRAIRCSLTDSGQFVLPAVVQDALAGITQAVVTLVRKRETRYSVATATLRIVQLSYH